MTLILKTIAELEAQHKAEMDTLNLQLSLNTGIFETEPDAITVFKGAATIHYKAKDINSALAVFNYYHIRDLVRDMEHRGPENNRFPSLLPFHLQELDSEVHAKYAVMLDVRYSVPSEYTTAMLVFYAAVNGLIAKVQIELNASPFKPEANNKFRGPVSTLQNLNNETTHQYVGANRVLIDSSDMTFDLTSNSQITTYGHFLYCFEGNGDIKLRIQNAVGNI